MIAALRPKSREIATGATIQFGEPYIVICASYDSGKEMDAANEMAELTF